MRLKRIFTGLKMTDLYTVILIRYTVVATPKIVKESRFTQPISVHGNWKAIGTVLYLYGKRRILNISPTKTGLGLINPIIVYVVLECQRTRSKNLSENIQSRSLEKA